MWTKRGLAPMAGWRQTSPISWSRLSLMSIFFSDLAPLLLRLASCSGSDGGCCDVDDGSLEAGNENGNARYDAAAAAAAETRSFLPRSGGHAGSPRGLGLALHCWSAWSS